MDLKTCVLEQAIDHMRVIGQLYARTASLGIYSYMESSNGSLFKQVYQLFSVISCKKEFVMPQSQADQPALVNIQYVSLYFYYNLTIPRCKPDIRLTPNTVQLLIFLPGTSSLTKSILVIYTPPLTIYVSAKPSDMYIQYYVSCHFNMEKL